MTTKTDLDEIDLMLLLIDNNITIIKDILTRIKSNKGVD